MSKTGSGRAILAATMALALGMGLAGSGTAAEPQGTAALAAELKARLEAIGVNEVVNGKTVRGGRQIVTTIGCSTRIVETAPGHDRVITIPWKDVSIVLPAGELVVGADKFLNLSFGEDPQDNVQLRELANRLARSCGSFVSPYTAPPGLPLQVVETPSAITTISADSRQKLVEFMVRPAPGVRHIALRFKKVPEDGLMLYSLHADSETSRSVSAPTTVFMTVDDRSPEMMFRMIPSGSSLARVPIYEVPSANFLTDEPPFLANVEMEILQRAPTGTALAAIEPRPYYFPVGSAATVLAAAPAPQAPVAARVTSSGPAATVTARASAATAVAGPLPVPAAAQAPAAAPAAPIDLKRWGALAGLIGTVWKDQFNVYTIEWDRPGEAIRIAVDGLFGENERLIVPHPDGKSLRYVYLDPASGERFDEQVPLERGKGFVSVATPTHRTICTPAAKGTVMNCTRRMKVRSKEPVQVTQMTRTDAAGGRALLASLPGRFPARPAGQFHPQLGIFADMSNRRWTVDEKPQPWSQAEMLEFGSTPQGPALITQIRGQFGMPRVVYLQGGQTGPLRGSYYSGTVDSPDFIASVSVSAGADGSTNICSPSGCDQWRLSRDGNLALRMRGENGGWTLQAYRPVPPTPAIGRKILDSLHGKTFQSNTDEAMSFAVQNGSLTTVSTIISRDRWTKYCATKPSLTTADCSATSGGNNNGIPFTLTDKSFAFDGYSYAMRGSALVRTRVSDGQETIFNPSSPGQVELAFHSDEDESDQRRLRREYRRQAADRERREREMFGAIMGAAQAIGGALAASNAPPSYTPVYQGGGGSGSSNQPSGYSSTMGTSTYVPHTPASAEYLRQQDEIERFKIREQLFGSGRGKPAERPYAAAYEQLARDNAEAEIRRAERIAELDASREQEARAFAASLDGNRAAADPNAASSASADAERIEQERVAAAQREAKRAEDIRIAKAEAEALRRKQADDEAKAEQIRIAKAAADAERTRQEALAAKERERTAVVAWKEGVVLCQPPASGKGEWACHGPLQTTYGVPDKPSGAIAVNQACGGGQVRELGQSGGFRTYGCGFGTSPLNAPNRDPAVRFGVFVPGRATYMCPKNQTTVCTSR